MISMVVSESKRQVDTSSTFYLTITAKNYVHEMVRNKCYTKIKTTTLYTSICLL